MRRLFVFLTAIFALSVIPFDSDGQDLSGLKKQKQTTAREIKETTKKLRDNKRETQRQLNRLSTLRGDMNRQNEIITEARRQADSVQIAIDALVDSITHLEADLKKLQTGYASALRRLQTTNSPATVTRFIFASKNVEQMYRRARYIKQFSTWRRRKADEIRMAKSNLDARHRDLDTLRMERSGMLQRASLAGKRLKNQETETKQLVNSLKNEHSSLQAFLAEKEKQQRELNSRIDRLIRAEQERQAKAKKEQERLKREKEAKNKQTPKNPAKPTPEKSVERPTLQTPDPDRALTGDFENNRGKLLFPVASRYTIIRDFGRQKHPDLPNVFTDNNGIDIEVAKGTAARAVFGGTVSAIFRQPGFGTIVMLRHGKYLTIYAGLASCSVKNGQTVKGGQNLGTILTDPDNDNKTILHFELRNERQKLNPRQWVR